LAKNYLKNKPIFRTYGKLILKLIFLKKMVQKLNVLVAASPLIWAKK